MRSFCVGMVVALIANTAFAQSPADVETARDLFKQATDLHEAGDPRAALVKYKAAHELGNTPVTGLELGRTYAELGKLIEAREVLLGVEKIPTRLNESEKTLHARAEAPKLAEELRTRIPSITIVVDSAPPGMTVHASIDGEELPATTIGIAHKLNPGSHTIVAYVDGGPRFEASTMLAETEARPVHVLVEGPPPPPVPSQPPPVVVETPKTPAISVPPREDWLTPRAVSPVTSTNPARVGAFVVGGVGLTSLLVMAGTGGVAASKASTVTQHCDSNKQCDAIGMDAVSSGKTFAVTANVAGIVGGVAVATAIVLFVVSARANKPDAPTTAFALTPTWGGGAFSVVGTLR